MSSFMRFPICATYCTLSCVDYFAMIQQYGADAVAANLKSWLSETSAMGCGDDITVLIAYFSDDTATKSEAATNE